MRRVWAGLLLLPLLAACGGVAAAPPPAESADPAVVSGTNAFGIRLLHQVRELEGEQNWFLSPTSASLALSMAASGAKGETQAEILKAIGLQGQEMGAVNTANRDLQSILTNPDPKVELQVANSLWVKEGWKLAPAFTEAAKANYQAEVKAVPFGKEPKASGAINDWVKKETRGKIPSVLERTTEDDRLYLINALYFKGAWQKPFEKSATREEPFRRLNGSQVQVQMMHQSSRYRYLRGDGFQAAALPFGEGRLSLYLFRPDDGVDLPSFMARLTPEVWEGWMAQFSSTPGEIALPRFELSSGADLKTPLQRLGMVLPFTERADLSGLFEGPSERLAISTVFQKTFLAIKEEGAEAAAVTVVGVTTTSAPAPQERFELRLDRPFFLAIRDEQTGALLFLGTIVDPS